MSFVRLANFIEIIDGSASPRRYQNAEPGQSIQLNGSGPSFDYLSFIYQGAAKNRTGDNLEAAIVLSVNEISQGIAKDAVMNKHHVNVYSVVLDSNYSPAARTLTEETWLAATMTYDYEMLEVILSSGIDAVGANAPTRVLTKQMVGRLPVTGNIQAG